MKTRDWRMCLVKQVPELSESSWMLFGESMSQGTNQGTNQGTKDKTTFQLEFKPYQETMLIQYMANMANMANMENMENMENMGVQIRMVLVTESPAVSCIGSLWALKGLEMYRRELNTEKSLVNSLHQDMNMLNLSPQLSTTQSQRQRQRQQQQQQQQQQQHSQSRHSMQTRSKTK